MTTATANKFTTTPANYTFAPMDGTFEITQKAATITANDQTVAYGASIATNDVTLTDVLSADQAAVKKAVIVYQEGNVLKVKANPAAAQADKEGQRDNGALTSPVSSSSGSQPTESTSVSGEPAEGTSSSETQP